MLELAFSSRALRAQCEDPALAAEELGVDVAEALRKRIADLRAATHPFDVPVGQLRTEVEHGAEVVFLGLVEGWEMVFQCNHPRPPSSGDSKVDWTKVSRIQILRIEGTP